MSALVFSLITCGQGHGEERADRVPPPQSFLQRLNPAGGWNPYGGGLLHWWNLDCFPRSGTPDDYCRKPLPRVCWPANPSFSTGAPPAIADPQHNGPRDGSKPKGEQ
jgi:hypothetical protein